MEDSAEDADADSQILKGSIVLNKIKVRHDLFFCGKTGYAFLRLVVHMLR